MATNTLDEILVGGMAIRPRIEPAEGDGGVAIHEFNVLAGASLPVSHSYDLYEETSSGESGQLRCVWLRANGGSGQPTCIWV